MSSMIRRPMVRWSQCVWSNSGQGLWYVIESYDFHGERRNDAYRVTKIEVGELRVHLGTERLLRDARKLCRDDDATKDEARDKAGYGVTPRAARASLEELYPDGGWPEGIEGDERTDNAPKSHYGAPSANGPGYPCEGAEMGVCGGEPHTEDCPSFRTATPIFACYHGAWCKGDGPGCEPPMSRAERERTETLHRNPDYVADDK